MLDVPTYMHIKLDWLIAYMYPRAVNLDLHASEVAITPDKGTLSLVGYKVWGLHSLLKPVADSRQH